MNHHSDPRDLPTSFLAGASFFPTKGAKQPGSMLWYDSIIDDILANPGTSIKDTAARLGRNPSTISAIVGADLFKARWAQRRAQFNDALDERLTAKLASVAEKSLDATIEVLDKKRDTIPLPVLNEVVKNSLDRLGYAPQTVAPQAPVQVNVSSNVVSAEALARARENLRVLESHAKRASDSEGPPLGADSEGFTPPLSSSEDSAGSPPEEREED